MMLLAEVYLLWGYPKQSVEKDANPIVICACNHVDISTSGKHSTVATWQKNYTPKSQPFKQTVAEERRLTYNTSKLAANR
jgi:hypothetical protein